MFPFFPPLSHDPMPFQCLGFLEDGNIYNNLLYFNCLQRFIKIGEERFELSTSRTRTVRATKLRYTPPAEPILSMAWAVKSGLFAVMGVDVDADRAVVEQGDFHIGAEGAAGDSAGQHETQLFETGLVKGFGDGGRGRLGEGGPVPFLGAGEEGELADEQEFSVNVQQAEVHSTAFIPEDAQVDQLWA